MACSTNSARTTESRLRNPKIPHGLVALVVAFAVLGVGCDNDDREPDRQEPGGPLYEMWNSEGDRVVVRDGSGESVYKLRLRSNGLKVYDRKFRALGYVDFPVDQPATLPSRETTDDAGKAGPADTEVSSNGQAGEIRVRRLGGDETERLKQVNADVWALGDRLRIERTAEGWAVFDGDAEWVGQFSRGDQGNWRLEYGEEGSGEWRVDKENGELLVRRNGETQYRAESGELPPEALLALGLEELSLLDRMAVAGWLQARSSSGSAPRE